MVGIRRHILPGGAEGRMGPRRLLTPTRQATPRRLSPTAGAFILNQPRRSCKGLGSNLAGFSASSSRPSASLARLSFDQLSSNPAEKVTGCVDQKRHGRAQCSGFEHVLLVEGD